jgi:predicted regulator of Ras-like GTPase activity (Roadblock/LC7/MglB family)
MKQKISAIEAETEATEQVVISAVDNENSVFSSLIASLAEIRKLKGVIGFILRSDTKAIIDFPEADKITQNAMLSSQIHESCLEIANQFSLGEMESMLVEGGNVKVLCMCKGENLISVFMDKSATHSGIIKRILI